MRCTINRPEACTDPVYDKIRVRVVHEDTGRKTKQTWLVCKLHFIMMQQEPERFYRWYTHKEAIATVVEIVETGLLEMI